jgi:hypothetical protein
MKTAFTFFMITFTVSILLNLGGVITDNEWTTSSLITDLFSGVAITSSQLYAQIGILITALLVAVGANTLTGGSSGAGITIVKTAFVAWLATIIADFISLIVSVKPADLATGGLDTVIYYIIFVIGGLIVVGYIYSLIDLLFEND